MRELWRYISGLSGAVLAAGAGAWHPALAALADQILPWPATRAC